MTKVNLLKHKRAQSYKQRTYHCCFSIMENVSDESVTINCLPNEVLLMILEYNSIRDVIQFGSTCKQFYQIVSTNQHVWRDKYRNMFPKDLYQCADSNGEGDWFNEIKRYYGIKQLVFAELVIMSPKYFWRLGEVTLEDITFFFDIALSHGMNLYYIVHMLQALVREGNQYLKNHVGVKPYTMTDLYYAKVVLRHLIQACLTTKWVQARMNNELTPERLVNFFLQWVDMENMHMDEDVTHIIKALGEKVKTVLQNSYPTKVSPSHSMEELCQKGLVTEKQVLSAITEVIYQQENLAVTSSADFELIDIKKIFRDKSGNVVVVAAVYQAVARLFGVKCELITFPNHLFLEWRSPTDHPSAALYTIDLETGKLHLKRRCTFSQNANSTLKYCPDSLLQYICSSFLMTMGPIKNWNTQNTVFLLDFLSTNSNEDNPYRNFLPYLLDHSHLPAFTQPINLRYLSDVHLELLKLLTKINTMNFVSNTRDVSVTKRDSRVKYAVGMICYHTQYEYACVIRDWDPMRHIKIDTRWSRETRNARDQPYYNVTAADQSDRFVAQDKLTEASQPTRLFTIEDIIATEFTHFNGYSYVPNAEKQLEYPLDIAIANMYASRKHGPRFPGDLTDRAASASYASLSPD